MTTTPKKTTTTQMITETELRKQIRQLVLEEQLAYKDILPGAEGEMIKFAEKVDTLLEEMVDKIDKLYQQGTELVKPDITGGTPQSSTVVGERNHYLLSRVGALKKIRNGLVATYEGLRRNEI